MIAARVLVVAALALCIGVQATIFTPDAPTVSFSGGQTPSGWLTAYCDTSEYDITAITIDGGQNCGSFFRFTNPRQPTYFYTACLIPPYYGSVPALVGVSIMADIYGLVTHLLCGRFQLRQPARRLGVPDLVGLHRWDCS